MTDDDNIDISKMDIAISKIKSAVLRSCIVTGNVKVNFKKSVDFMNNILTKIKMMMVHNNIVTVYTVRINLIPAV
jgi:hypothetical protein